MSYSVEWLLYTSITLFPDPSLSQLLMHLCLPPFFRPLNFSFIRLKTVLCKQAVCLAVTFFFFYFLSLWVVLETVYWTTVKSAVCPSGCVGLDMVIIYFCENVLLMESVQSPVFCINWSHNNRNQQKTFNIYHVLQWFYIWISLFELN